MQGQAFIDSLTKCDRGQSKQNQKEKITRITTNFNSLTQK